MYDIIKFQTPFTNTSAIQNNMESEDHEYLLQLPESQLDNNADPGSNFSRNHQGIGSDLTNSFSNLESEDHEYLLQLPESQLDNYIIPGSNFSSNCIDIGSDVSPNCSPLQLPLPESPIVLRSKPSSTRNSTLQRYQPWLYLICEAQLDNLPQKQMNGTTKQDLATISRFDKWFNSVSMDMLDQPALLAAFRNMSQCPANMPPFVRLCYLPEIDRGVVAAHFVAQLVKPTGAPLKAASKGLKMTSFQRCFRKFDVYNQNPTFCMTSWKSHPAYKAVKTQCELQCQQDAAIPIALQTNKAAEPMDYATYLQFMQFIHTQQTKFFVSNLKQYVFWLQADFLFKCLLYGGERGQSEIAALKIHDFVVLQPNLLLFRQSGITKSNQTGGNANFVVQHKPDLYFLGEELVGTFSMFSTKRQKDVNNNFASDRLFLQPLPSATFEDEVWFSNMPVGKNALNFVKLVAEKMKQESRLEPFRDFTNTSLRKLRTDVLSQHQIEDWKIGESMGHKDKKFQNLASYRKMNHHDKMEMASCLYDPLTFKKTPPVFQPCADSNIKLGFPLNKENCLPDPTSCKDKPSVFQPADKENMPVYTLPWTPKPATPNPNSSPDCSNFPNSAVPFKQGAWNFSNCTINFFANLPN